MWSHRRMKNKYVRVIIIYLVVGLYISYRYGVLSYLGYLMIMVTHELGHYMFAAINDKNPEFVLSSEGNFGVRYDGPQSLLTTAGGMIVNFLFLPLFVGMKMLDMNTGWIVLLIIGGSMSDIVKIVKMVKGLKKSE